MSALLILSQHSAEVIASAMRQERAIDWKKEIKLSPSADVIIWVIIKESTRELLNLISDFSKAAEYKIDTQNELYFYMLAIKTDTKIKVKYHL